MHKLLARQLRRHLPPGPDIPPAWQALLDSVSAAYEQADTDRLIVERSLELMSLELVGRNERLREEQSTLRLFMDSAPLMMGLVELLEDDIRFISVNPALALTLELTQEQLVGHSATELGIPLDDICAWLKIFRAVESSDSLVHIAREQPTAAGVRTLRVTGRPLPSLAGRRPRICYVVEDVTDELRQRRLAKEELEQVHKQLVDAARGAGMAEIAIGVLHNVGNVLNSVNVSATLVGDRLSSSKADNLGKVAALVREQLDQREFWSSDPRARQLPEYLAKLDVFLRDERSALKEELTLLRTRIDHIREIVAMQQSHASAAGLTELVTVEKLVESALLLNASSLERHGLRIIRELDDCPPLIVDKHKALQILVNLIRNACQACRESPEADKQLTIRVRRSGDDRIAIAVIDNGVGIAPENLCRIFNYGFTTRADGHGFGLHSGALAGRELGGALSVHSDGEGRGATFTLELPLQVPSGAQPRGTTRATGAA